MEQRIIEVQAFRDLLRDNRNAERMKQAQQPGYTRSTTGRHIRKVLTEVTSLRRPPVPVTTGVDTIGRALGAAGKLAEGLFELIDPVLTPAQKRKKNSPHVCARPRRREQPTWPDTSRSEGRNANENGKSRRTSPILRREPARGKSGNSRGLRSLARHAVFRIAARSAFPSSKFQPAPALHTQVFQNSRNAASLIGAPERPSGIGELINSLLRAGLSMAQIRALYPGLFSSPGPGG